MSGTILRIGQASVPDRFKHWSDLQAEIQAQVVARLTAVDAARAATANKHLDQLVQNSWPWPRLLRGSGRHGPLPVRPAYVIDALLAPCAQGGYLEDVIHRVRKRGVPFHEESIFNAKFETELKEWARAEELAHRGGA